jgi:hypothetical protein
MLVELAPTGSAIFLGTVKFGIRKAGSPTSSHHCQRLGREYRITYDSGHAKEFLVHKGNGNKQRFKQAESGLFYLDVTEEADAAGTVLVNTVDNNKYKYINAAYKQAVTVCL